MAAIRVLLPPLAVVGRDAPAAFRTLLARADRLEDGARGRAAALARAFSPTPNRPLAVAPVLRDVECGDAGDAIWICADPGHARADAGALRLLRCGDLDLARAEADALVRELKPLFGDAGFELSAPAPNRWFLRAIASDQYPESPDPEDILGDDLEAHLPGGRDAPKWRRLLNEAQVVLHNHEVNVARASRGALPANTPWFWGGGRRPELARGFRSSMTTDRVASALARAAGAVRFEPHALPEVDVPALVECWSPVAWTWFCREGHAQLARAIRRGGALECEAWSGERWRWRPAHRWRFWRKAP